MWKACVVMSLFLPGAFSFMMMMPERPAFVMRSSLAEQLTEIRLENEKLERGVDDEKEALVEKVEERHFDVTPVAAAVAAVAAMGVIVPATDLELAALVATAGYAVTRNDTSAVSDLVRSLGRLGETTVRMGLDAAFPKNTKNLQAAVAATPRGGFVDLAEEEVYAIPKHVEKSIEPVIEIKQRRRLPRPREAMAVSQEAENELATLASLERELRERETHLRAALAAKPKPTPRPPPKLLDQSPRLDQALDGLAALRSASRFIESDDKDRLAHQLQELEQQFRSRQAELRAAVHDAQAHTEARKRIESALQNTQEDLRLLDQRRAAAREKFARASAAALLLLPPKDEKPPKF